MKEEWDVLQYICVSLSLLLLLGLGFNLNLGMLMLDGSCFCRFFFLENVEGKEAESLLSIVVAKSLVADRGDDSDS